MEQGNLVGLVLPIHGEKRKHPVCGVSQGPEGKKDPPRHDTAACTETWSFPVELHDYIFPLGLWGCVCFPLEFSRDMHSSATLRTEGCGSLWLVCLFCNKQ